MKLKILFMSLLVGLFFGFNYLEASWSDKNKKLAEEFCAEKKKQGIDCKVSNWVGCGTGWKNVKRFGGSGKDWFACEKTDYKKGSENHQIMANQHCSLIIG